jgi:hypothetical protein
VEKRKVEENYLKIYLPRMQGGEQGNLIRYNAGALPSGLWTRYIFRWKVSRLLMMVLL